MRGEYEKLIVAHDRILSFLREIWMNADDHNKPKYMMAQIDSALDERKRIMRWRDEEPQ